MRALILALIPAVVLMLVLWRCQSEPTPPAQSNTAVATQAKPPAPGSRPLVHDTPGTTHSSIPRPDISPTTRGPVTLRREPRLPDESDLRYEWRTQFVIGFDWFRTEAKISEDTEREILRILGEAQQKLVFIQSYERPSQRAGGARWEAYKYWAPIYEVEIADAAEEEIKALLTRSQRASWKRYMSGLLHNFHLQYAQPLRIQPTPAG